MHATFNAPMHLRMYALLFGIVQDAIWSSDYDILIANSKTGAGIFEKELGRRVHVLYSPVDTRRFIPRAKENLVTAVGILIPRKRFEVIIDGVALARTKPKLAIIGNLLPNMHSYFESLKDRTRALGIEDRVSFHLNAPDFRLRNIVSRSKICVSAGVEYFSLAVLEQMSAGCVPIVSRSFVPWTEILEGGRYGYGFKSAEEIATTIDMLLTDSELCEKMSAVAIERSHEFDIDKFGEQLVQILLHG
jgi:glycosyltransferase involved in cell wall biosynthesis